MKRWCHSRVQNLLNADDRQIDVMQGAQLNLDPSSAEARRWLVHTYGVISQIELLLSKLEDAETGQRAYLLTGSEEYLEPYLNALRDTPGSNAALSSPSPRAMGPGKDASQQLTELGPGVADTTLRQHRSIAQELTYIRNLTADNPAQQSNLDEMDDVVKKLLDYQAATIQARRTRDAGATGTWLGRGGAGGSRHAGRAGAV